MASAESKNIVMIVLELTLDEATTIRDICMKTGGMPDTTRRGHTDTVLQALQSVPEVHEIGHVHSDMLSSDTNGIRFV